MPTAEQITKHENQSGKDVEWVSRRPRKVIEIVEYDPAWPATFEAISQRVKQALGERVVAIQHVGSTSVPGLAAKDVIDVDLVVADSTAEDQYVPALQAAGFQFLLREKWQAHRLFGLGAPYANLHVFGPDSTEVVRHRLFRDWLKTHEEDRQKYVRVKREAAEAARAADESVDGYNQRKEAVILEILARVFSAHGLV